jgi:hypothetical protein
MLVRPNGFVEASEYFGCPNSFMSNFCVYLHLDVVRGLECSNDPDGYAGRSFKLLVGSPKPDRPKVMDHTKRDTPALQRWGFVGQASNLPTVKNLYAHRTSKKPRKSYLKTIKPYVHAEIKFTVILE